MKMFFLPLIFVVFGIFSCFEIAVNGASLEDDLKNSVDIQRLRDVLTMETILSLPSEQKFQILSYLLPQMKLNKRDDDLPPGFIGVRGRRSNTDQQLSSFEDLYHKVLTHNGQNLLISPSEAKGMIKKGDNTNVYKDGFLGVRG